MSPFYPLWLARPTFAPTPPPRIKDFRVDFIHEAFLSSVVRSGKICPDGTTHASEVLLRVLESMQSQWLPSIRAENGVADIEEGAGQVEGLAQVEGILRGTLRSRVACRRCKHLSDTFESLPMFHVEVDSPVVNNVLLAIESFRRPEKVEYRCEACRRKMRLPEPPLVEATKEFAFDKAPGLVVI